MDAEESHVFTEAEFDDLLHVSDNLRNTLINAFTPRQLRDIIDISLDKISETDTCAEVYREAATTLLDHIKATPAAKLKRKGDTTSDAIEEAQDEVQAKKRRRTKLQPSPDVGSLITPPARPIRAKKRLVSLVADNEVPVQTTPNARSADRASVEGTGSSFVSPKDDSDNEKPESTKIEPPQWYLCVPNVDSAGENVVPFSALPESTQTELESSFNQSYGKGAAKSRRRQYVMIVKSHSQRDHYAEKGACINTVVSRRPYDTMTFQKADGLEDRACDSCTDQGRLCARVIKDGENHALYFYPLASDIRDGFGWKSKGYWISERGPRKARKDGGA